MARVELNIAIADPDRFHAKLQEAKKRGLKVLSAFEDLGVATGSIDDAELPGLKRIDGLTVEANRDVSVPERFLSK